MENDDQRQQDRNSKKYLTQQFDRIVTRRFNRPPFLGAQRPKLLLELTWLNVCVRWCLRLERSESHTTFPSHDNPLPILLA